MPNVKHSSKDGRRSANYKPNLWSHNFVESLESDYAGMVYREQAAKIKEDFMHVFNEATNFDKLQFIDRISKLGLSNMFYEDIMHALTIIEPSVYKNDTAFKEDIQATSLCFRILRQYGYNVPQDVFMNFIDKKGSFKKCLSTNIKGILELYEASHLARDGEQVMAGAKSFSYKNLPDPHLHLDNSVAKQVFRSLQVPYHWRAPWFEVRMRIETYEKEDDRNSILLELAKLNFNILQALHQKDLKEMSMWWRNLGLIDTVSFARDRLVESFLWTVGVAFEPQYTLLRKSLTRVVSFIIVIDDVYDIYGSLEELQRFTMAVERWDSQEIQQIPECMRICFQALQNTTNEIACEIDEEKGWDGIAHHYLRKAWTDFCKALLVEAQWYNNGGIPSLEDYLSSAGISSSGPLLSLVALLYTTEKLTDELLGKTWEEIQDLVYHTSLIIRLCNDLGTSTAEFERGDAPSSILCYMREANVSEDMARAHVKEMISSTWNKLNTILLTRNFSEQHQRCANLIINLARVCHFIYNDGDGFSVQDQVTRNCIKHLLIEPFPLGC